MPLAHYFSNPIFAVEKFRVRFLCIPSLMKWFPKIWKTKNGKTNANWLALRLRCMHVPASRCISHGQWILFLPFYLLRRQHWEHNNWHIAPDSLIYYVRFLLFCLHVTAYTHLMHRHGFIRESNNIEIESLYSAAHQSRVSLFRLIIKDRNKPFCQCTEFDFIVFPNLRKRTIAAFNFNICSILSDWVANGI